MNLVLLLIGFAILYTLQIFIARSFTLKFFVVTYLFVVSSAIYFSFDSFKGWPSDEKIHKAYLLAVHIVQPSPQNKGGIYVWTLEERKEPRIFEKLFGLNNVDVPRSYYLPFSTKGEQAFAEAENQLKKGMFVILDGDLPENKGEGEQQSEGNNQNATQGDGDAVDSGEEYNGPRITIVSPEEVMRK